MFVLYNANAAGNPENCSYPHRIEVNDADSLRAAVACDYVCAEYKNSYRANKNFISANCLPVDCDNDHSDDPKDWITPDAVKKAFSNVAFAVHYSRNNMREKNSLSARPRFHVLFRIEKVTDAGQYKAMKERVLKLFPFFDKKALDAARFFYGTASPKVEIHKGDITLTEFLDSDFDQGMPQGVYGEQPIREGSRNVTMSVFAGRVLKRYGVTEESRRMFLERAEKCEPPLDDGELETIWRSAVRFYDHIRQQDGYVPPEDYNADVFVYKPDDCTDVGQARMLGSAFRGELRYSPATDYIRYDGVHWQETKPGAQAVAHALTDLQMEEADEAMRERRPAYEDTGAAALIAAYPKRKALTLMNEEQLAAYRRFSEASNYMSFALQRRESKYVSATLHEARPVLELDPSQLDRDWFLLCTPDATYDLRKGLNGRQPHDSDDFITHVTAASPGEKGRQLWQDALNVFFGGNAGLINYVRRVAGVVCVGQVFWEAMIIAYGDGRNGKSTFWNTLARVLGSYSGNISADSLTVGCKRNVKPEMAETRGKRLLIAAELDEGTRINSSTVKQLTSTDNVFAEKKYKDPFSFTPSHTLVLYTNHLPRVGAKDEGIWRRLVVIPFTAKIEGRSDIKNYSDYLVQNAGDAIMSWMIEGAKEAIDLGYKIPTPPCVQEAIDAYRAQNDWLGHFISDRCETGNGLRTKSGELYYAYRSYCMEMNEYIRSNSDFCAALEGEGFTRVRTQKANMIAGLKLKEPECLDFLD